MTAAVDVRDEIALVLDKFLLQQELADSGLSEEEITRPRLPSDVVADAVSDDEEHDLQTDGIARQPASKLDPDQEKVAFEVASMLRHIGDEEFSAGGYNTGSEPKTRRFSIPEMNVDDLKWLVYDTQKFNEYMENHVNSHDPNVRQVAQVCKVTSGLIRLCRKANQAVSEVRENATNFVREKYGDWIASQGGMVQAVRQSVEAP